MRRGHATVAFTPCCGFVDCGKPMAFGVSSIEAASAALDVHYDREHGGARP